MLKRVEPDYPDEAKHKHLQGNASVKVLVNGEGQVEQACGEGPRYLREAAEKAALQWIFRPAQMNGNAIPHLEHVIYFKFVLDGKVSTQF